MHTLDNFGQSLAQVMRRLANAYEKNAKSYNGRKRDLELFMRDKLLEGKRVQEFV